MRGITYLLMMFSFVVCGQKNYLQSEMVRLSKPVISVSEVFFEKTTTMTVSDPEEGARIIYVYNDAATGPYKGPMEFRRSCRISAMVFADNYIESEATTVYMAKLPLQSVLSISSDRIPSEKYNAGGLDVLIDRKKGEKDFNKGWLGYGGDTISYTLNIEERKINMVKVSVLQDQKSWIFTPDRIEVYKGKKLLATVEVENGLEKQDDGFVIIDVPLEYTLTDSLEVRVIAHSTLPDWHPGVGHKPWIFVDEILIY